MSEIDDLIANIQAGKAPDKPDPDIPGVEVVERNVRVLPSDWNRVLCVTRRRGFYVYGGYTWDRYIYQIEIFIGRVTATLSLHELTDAVARKCCAEMLVGGNKFLVAYEWFDAERKMRLRHVLKEPFTKG